MARRKKSGYPDEGAPNFQELACTYRYPKGGAQCGYKRMPGRTRCSEHPVDLFPDDVKAKIENIALSTLEEIRSFQERIINEIYRDVIDPAKGKAIAEILKHQINILEKIWLRSPEAREASIEQIQKVMIMARDLDPVKALELLMEQDFKGILEYKSQFVDIEVEDGKQEHDAASETLLLGNFPGYGSKPNLPGMQEAGGAASIHPESSYADSPVDDEPEEDIF